MPRVGTSLKSRLFWTCLHIKGWRNKAGAVQQRLINQPLNHLGPNKEFKWVSEQRDKKRVKSHNQFQRPVTCTTKECKFMYVCFPSPSLLLTFTLPPLSSPSPRKREMKRQLLNKWPSGRNCAGNQWAISHWECLLCSCGKAFISFWYRSHQHLMIPQQKNYWHSSCDLFQIIGRVRIGFHSINIIMMPKHNTQNAYKIYILKK